LSGASFSSGEAGADSDAGGTALAGSGNAFFDPFALLPADGSGCAAWDGFDGLTGLVGFTGLAGFGGSARSDFSGRPPPRPLPVAL
jgi:hypothetical protein